MYTRYTEARERLGISDYEVAKLSGVSVSTIYEWLARTKQNPGANLSVDNARKVAKVLGITLDELLAEE